MKKFGPLLYMKINNLKFLIVPLFVVLSFFIFDNVKASVEYFAFDYTDGRGLNNWTRSDSTFYKTLPDLSSCSNAVAIVSVFYSSSSKFDPVPSSVVLTNSTLATTTLIANYSTANPHYNSVYVLDGSNNHDLSVSFLQYWEGMSHTITLTIFCNVDPDNPIIYNYSANTNSSIGLHTDGILAEDGMWFFSGSQTSLSSLSNLLYNYDDTYMNPYISYQVASSNSESMSAVYAGSGTFLVLNYKAPTPPPPLIDFNIRYLNEEGVSLGDLYRDYSGDVSVVIDYDFCEDYGKFRQIKLGLLEDNQNSIFDNLYITLLEDKEYFIGAQQCSGQKTFNLPPLENGFYAEGDLYLEFLIDYYDSDNITTINYLKSWWYSYYFYNKEFKHYLEFNKINYYERANYQFASSTPYLLDFKYNFCDSNEELALDNSEIFLYFSGAINGTSTTDFLLSSYDIASSTASTTCRDLSAEFEINVISGQKYKGEVSLWGFYGGDFLQFDNESYIDLYYPESIASSTMESEEFQAVFVIKRFFSNFFDGLIAPFRVLFPFNFVSILTSSYNASTISSFSSESDYFYLLQDSEGTIYLDLPVGDFRFFGGSIFDNSERTQSFFARIRVLTGWLQYAFLFYLIYFLARKVYAELTGADFSGHKIKVKEVASVKRFKRR